VTRKPAADQLNGMRDQAAKAARQVGPMAARVPMAQQAMPLARQGADTAVAWVIPIVDAARSWAAPQLEQSAHTINDNIAPAISGVLLNAAHKIEVPPKKQGHRNELVVGSMLLTAAASVAALLARRNRRNQDPFAVATATDGERMAGEETVVEYRIDGEPPDPDADGHSNIV
jgi:hypothetical protein